MKAYRIPCVSRVLHDTKCKITTADHICNDYRTMNNSLHEVSKPLVSTLKSLRQTDPILNNYFTQTMDNHGQSGVRRVACLWLFVKFRISNGTL